MIGHDDGFGDQPTRRIDSEDGVSPSAGEAAADALVGTTVGTIRLIEVLGGGGMGTVYRGIDEKLGRDVAVKAILSSRRAEGDARARFLREAQVLSRLNHPNICQVYDHIEGEENDFLVLELIDGESLRAAIHRGLPRQHALQIAVELADVLAVTHARGIVHRDLKPDNVMLTSEGTVKVLDFGLAREERAPQTSRRPAARGEAVGEELDTISSTVETVVGAVVGTVGYMSPEQARGEPASPPSDIYSLGLLLQELFTGRAPYKRSSTVHELLVASAMGLSSPIEGLPSELARLISEMKAVDPGQRPTAPEVTDRLRRIIDAPRRRVRWAAAIVAVAVAVGGSVKYTWDLSRERTAALAARSEALAAREDAEELLTFAFQDLYGSLVPLGRLDILKQVAGKALDYYNPDHAGDESLSDQALLRRSLALRNLGRVFKDQGDLDQAIEAYQASLKLDGRLVARNPANLDAVFSLGSSCASLGQIYAMRGDTDQALESLRWATEHFTHVVERDPGNPVWRRHLANAHLEQGNVLFMTGQLSPARIAIEQAIAGTRKLLDENPNDGALRADLGDRYRLLSQVLAAAGELEAARQASESDVALCLDLARRDERNASNLLGLLEGYTWQGRLLIDSGELADAVRALSSAVRFGERLIADDPTNTHWQFRLSASYDTLGEALTSSGRTVDALAAFDRALELMIPIAALDPSNAYYRNDLAYSYLQVGKARAALGRRSAARQAWTEAVTVVAPIADAEALPAIQETYAQALLLVGRVDEARPVVRRVLAAGWPLDPTTEQLCREHGIDLD